MLPTLQEPRDLLAAKRPAIDSFTDRQRQVFDLMGAGLVMHDIAARLGVGVKAVQGYACIIGDRLGLSSHQVRALAVLWRAQK